MICPGIGLFISSFFTKQWIAVRKVLLARQSRAGAQIFARRTTCMRAAEVEWRTLSSVFASYNSEKDELFGSTSYHVRPSLQAQHCTAGRFTMLRRRASTDSDHCRAMLKLLKGAAGSGGGSKNFLQPRSPAQLWTALGPQTSGYAENMLRAEENRTILPRRLHNFCKSLFTVAGGRLLSLEVNGCVPLLPFAARGISVQLPLLARQRPVRDEQSQGDLTRQEDPFDTITDKIPEKPVTVAEGASYSVVILLGLAIAGAAAYAVFKELVFEPKEYKVFGKALNRVQHDSRVSARLGAPITGYGQESRNRAARQRISNRTWTDEVGTERVEVMFHIRGPGGAGKVYSEMFKDPQDKTWKYTYLIVDVTSPSPTRLMLESYVPPVVPLNTM